MKKMLIVEDDFASQVIFKRIFREDFEIEVCESSQEYYEKHSSTIFDIIIMDISIKGDKNGMELLKEIKASDSYRGCPIICLSAHAQMKTRLTAMESGADLFLTKPVFNNDLKEAVANLIMKKKE